jgi:hypothetical protein
MRTTIRNGIVVLLLALPTFLRAQDLQLPPDVEKLSAKAKETVEVKMDGPMLRWASKFLSAEDPDERKAAKLITNLKGIYVRSFEFEKEGAYTSAEVEELRAQFRSPVWSRVVGVRSQHEGDNVDVFFKIDEDQMAGIVILAAEAKELTVVNIVGPIDVDQLADLGGEFGIPKLNAKTLPKSPIKSIAKADKGDQR